MTFKEKIMKKAISLAQRGKGLTAPNPCVGAVLVKDGAIIGEGWHKGYGLDHAEVDAIKNAIVKGYDVKDAELFVTLEPCNHFGKTPPCTEFILKHGIKKVFVGCKDPNPKVKGGGIEYLKSKGVEVECGILEKSCRELIEDFYTWVKQNRPYVLLKLASTLDGKIADRFGNSSWISNEKSRNYVQKLRSFVDAILVGSNTVYKDNPRLTCRIERKKKKQPLCVIVSRNLPKPEFEKLYLFEKRKDELVFFTTNKNNTEDFKNWSQKGLNINLVSETKQGFPDLKEVLSILYNRYECYYLLCEGGGKLATSLLDLGLVNEIILFFAPKVLGDELAICNFSGKEGVSLNNSFGFCLKKVKLFDDDVCLFLKPNNQLCLQD